MHARRFVLLLASVSILAFFAPSKLRAGDCFRQVGVGYSAGYNAPAPYAYSGTCAKLPGWCHWKSACCQPGTAPRGCGCGCFAPACGSCGMGGCGMSHGCRLGGCGGFGGCGGCGGCGSCMSCGMRNAAVY